LSNPRIDVLHLYAALLRPVLGECPDRRLWVVLDTTVLWNLFCEVVKKSPKQNFMTRHFNNLQLGKVEFFTASDLSHQPGPLVFHFLEGR
jgi:hypothetical protein